MRKILAMVLIGALICSVVSLLALEVVKADPLPPPVISGVDPTEPLGWSIHKTACREWLGILGTGFVPDSQVILRSPTADHTIPDDRTEYQDASRIDVFVGLYAAGTWTAQVVNPDGQESDEFPFQVRTPGRYVVSWDEAGEKGWYSPLGSSTTLETGNWFDFDSHGYICNHNMRHAGLDFMAAINTPIYSIADGTVQSITGSGTNERIWIKHETIGGSFFAVYGHIAVNATLKAKSKVSSGQQIGTIKAYWVDGKPNHHLHFGINVLGWTKIVENCKHPNNWGQTVPETNPRDYGWRDPISYLESHEMKSPGPDISAAIDEKLLKLIDEYVNKNDYWRDNWKFSRDHYKAWIATLAWAEGGAGGYSAHSQGILGSDVFNHRKAGTAFRFSTGIGPFQIDRIHKPGWTPPVDARAMPTIDKLDYATALRIVLQYHYSTPALRDSSWLVDFNEYEGHEWYGATRHDWPALWKAVTGTDWNAHKDKNSPLDWDSISKQLALNAEAPVYRYENNVKQVGTMHWNISEVIERSGEEDKEVRFVGPHPTWLVTARRGGGTELCTYYYTLNRAEGIEVWVWNNPDDAENRFRHVFLRDFKKPVGAVHPEDRDGGVAGRTLSSPALDPGLGFTRILTPTSSTPATAGDPEDPVPIFVSVEWAPSPVSNPPETPTFSVYLGGEAATYELVDEAMTEFGIYTLEVRPPTQPGEDLYHLEVRVTQGELADYHIQANAVKYTSAPPTEPIEKGLAWLRTRQSADGSWRDSVGVTSLAVLAFLNAGYDETDATVSKAMNYILARVRADGSIYGTYYYHATYETSLAMLPLVATRNTAYSTIIGNAKNWLVNSQWDESCLWGSVSKDNWYYGGFGYGYNVRPDLSNTQFALLALDAAGLPKSDPLWTKVQVFLHRTQNINASVTLDIEGVEYTVHPYNHAGGYDGGFIYYPGASLAGGQKSYGSMTGAGIWGLLLSGVPRTDARVAAAMNWVENHYTWDTNPVYGSRPYYYYMTMSKALTMLGQPLIGGHDWYQDLYDKLAGIQIDAGSGRGYWSSTTYEDFNPDLTTAYAVLSLQTRAIAAPVQRLSYLTFILRSNCHLRIIDPEGNLVGYNYITGLAENQIPSAVYSGPFSKPQHVVIVNPRAGTYRLELVGISEGPYELTIQGNYGQEVIDVFQYAGQISRGELHGSDIIVTAIVGPIDIYASPPEFEEFVDLPAYYSTYKFEYTVPDPIVVATDVDIDVTFMTDEEGDIGYDGVRFRFEADGPGDVAFRATDSEGVEHTFLNNGFWGPGSGFDLPALYSATTAWTLNFLQKAGDYTITFSLVEAPDGDVIADITETVTITVKPLSAAVTIDPETLNLQAPAKWITAYIELPADYAAADIDINAVQLIYNGNELYADWANVQNRLFMVKFDWATVAEWFDGLHDVDVELTVAGEVDEIEFEGTATIRVIDPPRPPRRGR